MSLDFVLTLILHRFLLKFLLLLRCKLGAGVLSTAIVFCCTTAAVVAWETPCTSASIIFLSSFVSNFPVASASVSMCKGLGVVFALASAFACAFVSHKSSPLPSAFSVFGSLFGIVCTLLLAQNFFNVSDFEYVPSSPRSAMFFSPAVGFALDLPAAGYALSVLLIFPCCWVCSSRGPRIRVDSFLPLTTGSLAVVPSLASSSVTLWLFTILWFASGLLQNHCSALHHFVIVGSRLVHSVPGKVATTWSAVCEEWFLYATSPSRPRLKCLSLWSSPPASQCHSHCGQLRSRVLF